MLTAKTYAVATALLLATSLSFAASAADTAPTRDGVVELNSQQLAADYRSWNDMYSRDPYPGMGVGNIHPKAADEPTRKIDQSVWEDMFSREPYPSMGVGSAHAPQISR